MASFSLSQFSPRPKPCSETKLSLTRERDRSPHVHQGKISNNFLTKLSFYYPIIAV